MELNKFQCRPVFILSFPFFKCFQSVSRQLKIWTMDGHSWNSVKPEKQIIFPRPGTECYRWVICWESRMKGRCLSYDLLSEVVADASDVSSGLGDIFPNLIKKCSR